MADALSSYGEGVKWQIGLSTAALAGLWAKLEFLLDQPVEVRYAAAGIAALLVASVWVGAEYLRWLIKVPTIKDRMAAIEAIPIGNRTAEQTADLARLNTSYQEARDAIPSWHRASVITFFVTCLVAAAGVFAAVSRLQPAKKTDSPTPVALRYQIALSAVHQTGHGREAHTFLLDQSTGDVWQMVCTNEGLVSFRRIRKLDFDGKPEQTASGKALEKSTQ